MSDDFDFDFDDDSLLADSKFLREVDNIAAQAVSQPPAQRAAPGRSTSLLNANGSASKGWTGPQRSVSSSSTFAPSSRNFPPGPHRPAALSSSSSTSTTRPAPARALPISALPPSDEFDDIPLPLPADQLSAIDSIPPRPVNRPPSIPSSRLGRTSSGSNSIGFQTHLNFRKENQTTKGKRWDRTAFAESGRRIGAVKGKKQAKGKKKRGFDDEDEEDTEAEGDSGAPLVPYPKPLVDPNKPYESPWHLPNSATIKTYIYPTNRPKREYQFDIVRACFTDNCLVALPTGLGKTFVAGVVMLNYYRWFPTGKIVFLAPTKPLVHQQIEACQMTCGIPSADAAVMTGANVSAKERAKLWAERRVFYCTPQTLDNDLKKGSVDPRDIVLAVFDEAHKASGSYAYTTILACITAHHPYFRVLALTATPGADVPRVQAVVDALHISRIEIREAEAPGIRKYMNEKRTEKHFVAMGEVVEDFRDRWAALMKPYVVKLVEKDILTDRDLDIKRLKPFRLTARRMEIARDPTSGLKWCLGSLQSLERMARAMGHLLEFSIGMFHTLLLEICGGQTADGKKSGTKGGASAMRNNSEFRKLLGHVEEEMNCIRIGKGGKTKASRHPKMEKALELLLAHFAQAEEDEKVHGTKNDTRAMVFCSFRDCVLEVVDMLNDHSPVLRATKFVGQSQGKQEVDKGFNQKEQKRTINEFKEGKFNILVSTSIGEEGLDIGEVDFVVIYDMPKQSIKLLQRIGRTGRKRDGQVHVLMSEGREDANWDTAQATHREIQEEILHSRNLELFEDVERLLPPGKLPECVEEEMPVDPWDPEDQKLRKKLPAASTRSPKSNSKTKGKEKESKRRGHEIPEGAPDGFKSVAQLLRDADRAVGDGGKKSTAKGKNRKRARSPSPIRSEDEEVQQMEDEDDEAEMELLYGGVPRAKKAKVDSGPSGSRRSSAKVSSGKTRTNRKTTIKAAISLSSDDEGPTRPKPSEEAQRQAEREELNRSALDFFNTQGPRRQRPPTPERTPPSSPSILSSPPQVKARKLPILKATHPPLSPNTDESLGAADRPPEQLADLTAEDQAGAAQARLTPRTATAAGFSQIDLIDLLWEDDEFVPSPAPAPMPSPSRPSYPPGSAHPAPVASNRSRTLGLSRPRPAPVTHTLSTEMMPPPPLPAHRLSSPASHYSHGSTTPVMDATQFPIRRAGRRGRVLLSSSERHSEAMELDTESPLAQPVRLRRRREEDEARVAASSSPPPVRAGRAGRRKRADPSRVKEFLDLDAELSGSDSGDEPSSDVESESDRLFANDFQPTQAPRGYDQRAAYVAGLSTQAGPAHGLRFAHANREREGWMGKARKPVYVTDDEQGSSASENEYELGSFVCPDEEDLSFATQSDPMSCG